MTSRWWYIECSLIRRLFGLSIFRTFSTFSRFVGRLRASLAIGTTRKSPTMSSNTDKSSFQPIDLAGKVIIKVQLGDDIRKVLIHNESITYDELLLMMQRIFNGKFTANDDLTIKYKDEDGDLVTVFDSQDLSFALQTSRVLKLQVFLNNQELIKPKLNAEEFKKQLREIRDSVTWLLDTIEVNDDGNSNDMPASIQQESFNIVSREMPTDNGITKEFDPLRNSKEEQPKAPQAAQVKTDSSHENVAASPQPQRQTPPVQQSQMSQNNMYNGHAQGAMNQHNPYPGGQIPPPPQGPPSKWVNAYQPGMRPNYPPTAQYSYVYSAQIPASGYSQITAQMKPPAGNQPVHSLYYPTNTTPNQQYPNAQYQGQ